MSKRTILVVDDEAFVRSSLVDLLESEGYRALTAAGAAPALSALEKDSVDAIVSDLRMPDADGLELLRRVREAGVDAPMILLTGVGTVTDAVAAMKMGAYDFIQKPVDPEQFSHVVRRAVEHGDLVTEVRYLRDAVKGLQRPTDLIGVSRELEQVRALVEQVAPREVTVLITGESGTGKELVAGAVHSASRRAERNLVRINCAAISETLFESEFFGHRRGAFTSAVADRRGRFAEAEGGTLILDEIGTLRPEMQAKLLRVLETGEYQVVGESCTRTADVRVIAATNEDLETRVRAGSFRADLYYRLNVFPIHIPPLRERRDDVAPLAEHFLARARRDVAPARSAEESRLSPEALETLAAYDWPGNVRELRNIIERAVILAGRDLPDAGLFRSILGDGAGSARPRADDLNIRRRVDRLERDLIAEALGRSRGKKSRAAELLGIDPKNLGYYLRKHAVAEPNAREEEP